MHVPFLDLKAQYSKIKDKIQYVINDVCENQKFILGNYVEEFEKSISKYSLSKYAVGVSSGTDALLISLMALGIKSNDIVITTPYTFFATAGAICRVGATPVFIDIDKDTFNMSMEYLDKVILSLAKMSYGFSRVKAIIPVHLFGQCADMDEILQFAENHNIKVIEDSAQAIGSVYKDKRAGTMGDLSCFSFFPTKNLGAFGDGGMVTTNDKDLYEKLLLLRSHGASPKYHHKIIGGNFRLDEIQAAILYVKLKYLDEWTLKRKLNAKLYNDYFKEYELLDIVTPPVEKEARHIYNQYVIYVKDKRDELIEFLKNNNIGTEVYYPIPLHLQECFSKLGYKKGDFPNSEYAAEHTLALPIYPELNGAMIKYTVEKIKEFYYNAK